MKFRLLDLQFHVLPMQTRFPFRYGIASLTALPHLLVTAVLEVDGREVRGITSEGLAPKWFTKHPDTSLEQDLAEMLAVIQNAAGLLKTPRPHLWISFPGGANFTTSRSHGPGCETSRRCWPIWESA